jgi:hypothetical protein
VIWGSRYTSEQKVVVLETIHDHRNPIQHSGASVSKAKTESFINITYDFIRRFLKYEFNIDLGNIVEPHYYEVLHKNILKGEQLIKYISRGEITLHKLDEAPSEVLREYRYVRTELDRLAQKLDLQQHQLPKDKPLSPSKIINILISDGKLPKETRDYFTTISTLRDKVANTQERITMVEFDNFGNATMMFKNYLEMIQ